MRKCLESCWLGAPIADGWANQDFSRWINAPYVADIPSADHEGWAVMRFAKFHSLQQTAWSWLEIPKEDTTPMNQAYFKEYFVLYGNMYT